MSEGLYRMMVRGSTVEEYLVDLKANKPVGWCGCADFEYRRFSKKDGSIEDRQCKHIRTAIEELGKKVVRTMLKDEWTKELRDKADKLKARRTTQGILSRTETISSGEPNMHCLPPAR